jgi:hypothetical protein
LLCGIRNAGHKCDASYYPRDTVDKVHQHMIVATMKRETGTTTKSGATVPTKKMDIAPRTQDWSREKPRYPRFVEMATTAPFTVRSQTSIASLPTSADRAVKPFVPRFTG